MNEESKETPFLVKIDQDNSQKQISIRSKKSKHSVGRSQISEASAYDPHLYDLPDLSHVTKAVMCRLIAVSVVCVIFLVAEIVGGLYAKSLAILSDAAHMFSDMSGFFISIFSIWLAQKPASQMMSFGYHRAEVIGALGSITLIWGLTIVLFYEATMRVLNKSIVEDALVMLITAGFGLFCNIVMAKVLHSSPTGGHDHGNIMHQCSGHDHGHGHGHGHSHDNPAKKKKSSSPSKKKVHVHQKRSVLTQDGVSLLVVEQQFSSKSDISNDMIAIQEDSNENNKSQSSQEHNHSQSCKHNKKNQEDVHNHSDNCNHSNKIEGPIDPNQESHQDIIVNSFKKQSNKGGCDGHGHEHDHSHEHDHEHEHDHDHDHDHSHSHNHDHNHDHHGHDHGNKGNKKQNKRSANFSQLEEQDNVNLKAAMIHVLGDILQSIGVVIAAVLIYIFGQEKDEFGKVKFSNWQYADPICTYIFSLLVLFTTFGVAKECLRVLMEGTPKGLILNEFREALLAIPRVKQVHDLHIWSLSVGKPTMSAHIVCKENPEYVLRKATKLCREFGIYHSTIQIELMDRQGMKDYIKCDHNIHK